MRFRIFFAHPKNTAKPANTYTKQAFLTANAFFHFIQTRTFFTTKTDNKFDICDLRTSKTGNNVYTSSKT